MKIPRMSRAWYARTATIRIKGSGRRPVTVKNTKETSITDEWLNIKHLGRLRNQNLGRSNAVAEALGLPINHFSNVSYGVKVQRNGRRAYYLPLATRADLRGVGKEEVQPFFQDRLDHVQAAFQGPESDRDTVSAAADLRTQRAKVNTLFVGLSSVLSAVALVVLGIVAAIGAGNSRIR